MSIPAVWVQIVERKRKKGEKERGDREGREKKGGHLRKLPLAVVSGGVPMVVSFGGWLDNRTEEGEG